MTPFDLRIFRLLKYTGGDFDVDRVLTELDLPESKRLAVYISLTKQTKLGRFTENNGLWRWKKTYTKTGAQLRDEGVRRVDAHTPEIWKSAADDAISALANECRRGIRITFTPEDVRALAGDPPHPNAMGARFLRAVRLNLIQSHHWSRASRPEAHACRLQHYTA